MNKSTDTSVLAREVARERTEMKRERINLGYLTHWGGDLLASLWDRVNARQSISKDSLEYTTFCTYNPAGCRGIA
jgi:hypothetical protein